MKKNSFNIAVVGIGYVGLSNAILLAQNNNVTAIDTSQSKVDMLNKKIVPFHDSMMEKFLAKEKLNLVATSDKYNAYKNSDFIIVATPTDYNPETNAFDTSSVENVIKDIIDLNNTDAAIIIKSTVPVGFTKKIRVKYNYKNIIFAPEFLQEGKALHDNLFPSRIIIGEKNNLAKAFATLMKEGAKKNNIDTLYMSSSEAEAVKLFSNTYLAMRVSFFNELDSYSLVNKLDTKNIIDGVCLDPRIGKVYNNPSFGFGGYCLPKDTKQLVSSFHKNNIPQKLIEAIISSNKIRKDFIADEILKMNPKNVGLFKLTMKEGSDNFRSSAIKGILKRLKSKGMKIIIYEPELKEQSFHDCEVIENFVEFESISDLILANRLSDELQNIDTPVFSRDLYRES